MLVVEGLTCRFGAMTAVKEASFEIARGSFIGVIGRSGAGKSTLLRMINRLVEPSEGKVMFEGVDVTALKGKDLELALGYSHPVPVKAPEGIVFEVPQPTKVIVKGNSKQMVGEMAAYIRKQRPPEPYKGKGIRYEGEYVARKVGKRA